MFVVYSYGNRPMNRLSYLLVWSEWAILSVPEWLRSAFWNIGVLPISYFGLFVGGLVLGISHRRSRNAMILLFIATVLVVMAGFTSWIDWTKPGFRFVRAWMFLALPSAGYHWRLGFILGPLAILIGDVVGAGLHRSASRLVPSRSEDFGSAARR